MTTRPLQVLGAASEFPAGETFTYAQLRKALPDMFCPQVSQSVSRLLKRGLLKRVAPATYIYPTHQARVYLTTEGRSIDPVDLLPVAARAIAKRPALERAWA